jgi:putative aldouronate transport system substrate-binding protein
MKEKGFILKKAFCLVVMMFMAASLFAGGGVQGSRGAQVKTLKALVSNKGGNDMNDGVKNPVSSWLNEVTGYTVTYDQLPADSPYNKLNAIMAAGAQDYDFIIIPSAGKDRYAEYAIQGALMDIGAVFQDYPNLQAIPQSLIDVVSVNNTFYALPTISPSGRTESANVDNFLLWRTDILAAMGRKMPATLDEFTTILGEYKDRDPMKNGSANVPLTVSINDLESLRTSSIGGAFGIELTWQNQGSALVPYQIQPGFFEYLRYLNDLYARGLMDREMPTNNNAAIREKYTTNKALVRVGYWWDIPSLVATFKTAYPAAVMEFGQPLEHKGRAGARANSKNQIDLFTVIPRNAKNWQAAMDYFNRKMEPAVFKEMVIGKEGIDFTVNAQGGFDPVIPAFFEHRGNANWYITGAPVEYNQYWLCRAKKDADQYKAYSQVNFDYGRFIHVDPASDVPCTTFVSLATANALSESLTQEFVVNSVVSGVTQAQFDAFVSNWKAQCGNILIDAYNGWYKNH